jgi:succinyldiaminopimelate transaminase
LTTPAGFVPPPYPYDRLNDLKPAGEQFDGGLVDLSIGTPFDPPAPAVLEALAGSGSERSYPPSIGTEAFRSAAADWLNRYVGLDAHRRIGPGDVRATIGSKEFVAGLPHWLKLRNPQRDTVLYPAVSYPSYAMGATLAGCRAVPVPVDARWRIDLSAIDEADAGRALCLWVNTPGNPAGGLDDLDAVARWGRDRGVWVASDECYIAFTWEGPPRSIIETGLRGVLAVHSLSKRSNLAGVRTGFYVGDPELIDYLGEVRKHAGFMAPGPAQAAAIAALADESHVEEQRARYLERLHTMHNVVVKLGAEAELPGGGFYLWVPAPGGDAWAFARRLADEAGALVSPGEFYGQAAADHVRIAVVQPTARIRLLADRLGL